MIILLNPTKRQTTILLLQSPGGTFISINLWALDSFKDSGERPSLRYLITYNARCLYIRTLSTKPA